MTVVTGPGLFVPAITRPRMRTSKRPWRSSVAVPVPTHGTLPRVTSWIGMSAEDAADQPLLQQRLVVTASPSAVICGCGGDEHDGGHEHRGQERTSS